MPDKLEVCYILYLLFPFNLGFCDHLHGVLSIPLCILVIFLLACLPLLVFLRSLVILSVMFCAGHGPCLGLSNLNE